MSTVQDAVECPQCKGTYIRDFDIRTHEEYCFCTRCGKFEEHTLRRDDEGNIILNDDGTPVMDHSSGPGYGIAKIAYKDGPSALYPLSENYTEAIKESFFVVLENPDVCKEESSLIIWNEEKKELEAIYGKIPQSYEEDMQEMEEACLKMEGGETNDEDVF